MSSRPSPLPTMVKMKRGMLWTKGRSTIAPRPSLPKPLAMATSDTSGKVAVPSSMSPWLRATSSMKSRVGKAPMEWGGEQFSGPPMTDSAWQLWGVGGRKAVRICFCLFSVVGYLVASIDTPGSIWITVP